jgi:malonate transporter
VWGMAWAMGAQGLAWSALIMAAALPSASNVSMLAEREGARTPAVPRIILLTTALAVLTLAAWAGALGLTPRSPR